MRWSLAAPMARWHVKFPTFPLLCYICRNICLFKWSPFEVFLVASAIDTPSLALLTSRLCLVAFEAFRFTGNTTCDVSDSVCLKGLYKTEYI